MSKFYNKVLRLKVSKYNLSRISVVNPVWDSIRSEAEMVISQQREMTSVVYSSILKHENLESVLSYRLAQKLSTSDMSEAVLNEIILSAYETEKALCEHAYYDIVAVK